MTLISAICNKKGGAIVADNMISFDQKIKSKGISSTGQIFRFDKSDTAFKICKISDNCILSFAGDVAIGKKVIEKLKKIERYNQISIEEILKKISVSNNQNVSFLICFYDNNECKLLKWQIQKPLKFDYGNYFSLGSGTSILADINPDLIDELLESEANFEKKGAALSFYYNQKLIHKSGNELSKIGVGGCFFSFSLDENGVKPQKDTVILKGEINKRNNQIHFPLIKQAYRRGLFFINSTVSGDKKLLINDQNCNSDLLDCLSKFGINALEQNGFDLLEIWDLKNVENIEIHFEYNNIPSHFQNCKPGEFLKFGENRKDVVFDKKLEVLVNDLLSNAR
ncbi:MAG TPA: hypothetical protein VGA80_01635 [Flavobacteriaceae bacterium]